MDGNPLYYSSEPIVLRRRIHMAAAGIGRPVLCSALPPNRPFAPDRLRL